MKHSVPSLTAAPHRAGCGIRQFRSNNRERLLARHVMLYAHSEREVVLLSMRHERQLGYGLPRPSN